MDYEDGYEGIYDMGDEIPQGKIVHGFLENELEWEYQSDRSSFSNYELCEHLDSHFRLFGKKDMDIILLYFLSKKRQDELMQILEKTQPAISYDVSRIRKQIEYVMRVVEFIDEFIVFIVDENIELNTHEKELLTVFFYSTSIIKTSKILNQNHITCRTHINNTINKLKDLGYIEQYEFFSYMLNNLNKIKKQISVE
jgi:predicted transcriptional regulator